MKEDVLQATRACHDEDIFCNNLSDRDARSVVFHLLYAVDCFDYQVSLQSITDNFARGFNLIVPKDSAVYSCAESIINERNELDSIIRPLLDNWRFDRLGVATRLIMRIAIWEFLNTKIDDLVIINEAIELAKCFAEKDAYKFINGVLDEFIKNKKKSEGIPVQIESAS